MGQTLNMKIVAEGVELEEQVEYLKSINCDYYQGYFFSKPLSVVDFEKEYIS
jgi:EAL domain-containing protein (putative c-di-GMP-specific phosphodiesterase class I)